MQYKFLLSLILILTIAFASNAQLYRGNADWAGVTDYEVNGVTDSIFVFDSTKAYKFVIARPVEGDTAEFKWAEYIPVFNNFRPLDTITSDSSIKEIFANNVGYRVIISSEGVDDTAYCWAINVDFKVEITSGEMKENEEGDIVKQVSEYDKWCDRINDVTAEITEVDTIRYYNWFADTAYTLGWNYTLIRSNWRGLPSSEESDINNFEAFDYRKVDIVNPHWEDSWYSFTVTDKFGITRADSIFNESIAPHAEFTYDYIRLDNPDYYDINRFGDEDRYNEIYGFKNYEHISAPAKYLFTNLSENTVDMEILFGDGSSAIFEDSIVHEYKLPGDYKPILIVFNEVEHLYDACVDTFPKNGEEAADTLVIEIEEAQLAESSTSLPNVFAIDGGEYSFFRFIGDVSISYFNIHIFNRFGKRVYEFEGNMRDWPGWDGTEMNSGKYVNTGVYYYVVKSFTMLPDAVTGRVPNLFVTSQDLLDSEDDNQQGLNKAANVDSSESVEQVDTPNTLLKGFVHVYNSSQK